MHAAVHVLDHELQWDPVASSRSLSPQVASWKISFVKTAPSLKLTALATPLENPPNLTMAIENQEI